MHYDLRRTKIGCQRTKMTIKHFAHDMPGFAQKQLAICERHNRMAPPGDAA